MSTQLESSEAAILSRVIQPDSGDWPQAAAEAILRIRSEEHTSELQSRSDLVCRLLLEKKKKKRTRAVSEDEHGTWAVPGDDGASVHTAHTTIYPTCSHSRTRSGSSIQLYLTHSLSHLVMLQVAIT